MAYGLKYKVYKAKADTGNYYGLQIFEKDYSGPSYYMDNLQDLRLEVQGNSGVDAPIVKTSLRFTLADERSRVAESGHKCGHWEEFYTPDSTKYKVVLYDDVDPIWSGFITPDSYSDNLVYNGSITITARDNLGHLSDFIVQDVADDEQFAGLIEIEGFLESCRRIAGVPMEIVVAGGPRLMSAGVPAHSWRVEYDAIKEKNLYEAAEEMLAGAGLCLRYTGDNELGLLTLRGLHLLGTASPGVSDANFINRSGNRTLDPAYKQIVDKLNYDFAEGLAFEFGYILPHTQIEPEVISRGDFEVAEDLGWTRRWKTTSKSEWKQKTGDYQVLATAGQAIYGEELAGTACFLTAVSEAADGPWDLTSRSEYVAYRRRIGSSTGVNFSFALSGVWTPGFVNPTLKVARMASGQVRLQIAWKQVNGTYLYLDNDGVWYGQSKFRTVDIERDEDYGGGCSKAEANSISLEFVTPPVMGELEIRLYDFEHGLGRWVYSTRTKKEWTPDTNLYYVMMSDASIDFITDGIAKGLNTTTIYDEVQNYTLKRDSKFGMLPEYIKCPGTIINGYYTDAAGNPGVSNVAWSDAPQNEMPLPVAVHLQLLALHAKANNILTGTLRDADGSTVFPFNREWHYAQRKFILQSGQWNLLTGFIDGAQLREFDTYEEAIGVASIPDYKALFRQGDLTTASLRKAINAVAGGGYAPTGGGGVVGVTSVGLQMPDEFEVENTPITGVGDIVVTLAEGYKIPTEAQLDKLDELPEEVQEKLIAGTGISIAPDGKTISATGGGGGVLKVSIQYDGDDLRADKTFAEIQAALQDNKYVFAEYDGTIYSLAGYSDYEISFYITQVSGFEYESVTSMIYLSIYDDESISEWYDVGVLGETRVSFTQDEDNVWHADTRFAVMREYNGAKGTIVGVLGTTLLRLVSITASEARFRAISWNDNDGAINEIYVRFASDESVEVIESDVDLQKKLIAGTGISIAPNGTISATSSGIPEAPDDGKTYGRKNRAWTEITGGGSDNTILLPLQYSKVSENIYIDMDSDELEEFFNKVNNTTRLIVYYSDNTYKYKEQGYYECTNIRINEIEGYKEITFTYNGRTYRINAGTDAVTEDDSNWDFSRDYRIMGKSTSELVSLYNYLETEEGAEYFKRLYISALDNFRSYCVARIDIPSGILLAFPDFKSDGVVGFTQYVLYSNGDFEEYIIP